MDRRERRREERRGDGRSRPGLERRKDELTERVPVPFSISLFLWPLARPSV